MVTSITPGGRRGRIDPPASAPLLLADHPALDFLNTRPGMYTPSPLEFIADGKALLDWLLLAGLIFNGDLSRIRRRFAASELDAVTSQARALREKLRTAVSAWVHSGAAPARDLLGGLNRLLAAAPTSTALATVGGRLHARRVRRFDTPQSLLSAIAESFASLFVQADRRLIRECEASGCSLWFYDRTKSHRRRWCNMAACGTRAKVATFRARRRAGEKQSAKPRRQA